MSNTLFKVENAEAERLWRYILAYRKMIGNFNGEPLQSSVALGLIPTMEQPRTAARPKTKVESVH